MKKIFYFLLLLLMASLPVTAQNGEKLFEEATQLYADGKFEQAIKKYEQIIENDQVSTAVYYNLANAHYKLNHIAPSIYNYEKALQLSPNDEDVKNNLAFAQNMTLDAIEEAPQTGISKSFKNVISFFDYNSWAWLSIVFSVLFAASALLYYFATSTVKKRLFFVTGLLSIIFLIVSVSFAYLQFGWQQSKEFAIIFTEEIAVKAEPNTKAEEVFTLHEGTKVKVLDNFNNYTKIELADKKQGWMPEKALKKL